MSRALYLILCGLACAIASLANETCMDGSKGDGNGSDDSSFLQSKTKTIASSESVAETAVGRGFAERGVCYLRGDPHIITFDGRKFFETQNGNQLVFEVHGLQGASPSEPGDLSLTALFDSQITQAVLKSGLYEFSFAANDNSWNAVGTTTAGPNSKLSFTVDSNVLRITNNGDTNLPDGGLLWEITALPRGSHVNLVVNITYGEGCPALVDGAVTPLTYSGLCGSCDTGRVEIGNAAIGRSNVDGFNNFYLVDCNTRFADDGLLTNFTYFIDDRRLIQFSEPLADTTFGIFRQVGSSNDFEVIANSTASVQGSTAKDLQAFTYYLSPALPVTKDDCIGWRVDNRATIPFDVSGTSGNIYFTPSNFPEADVGSTLTLNGPIPQRLYSILFSYVPNP